MPFLITTLILSINAYSTPNYVTDFHNLKNKKEEIDFIFKYQKEKNSSAMAYVIAAEMKQAEYALNPISKLSIFNKNKEKLNNLINVDNTNIHLRYIRLLLQEKTPSFLGYNKHIDEDLNFLKEKIKIEDSTDYLDSFILKNTSL